MSTKIKQLTRNKRIGRPRTVATTEHGIITVVLGPLTARVESYMAKAGCTTRAEAIRDLIRIGLAEVEKQ